MIILLYLKTEKDYHMFIIHGLVEQKLCYPLKMWIIETDSITRKL